MPRKLPNWEDVNIDILKPFSLIEMVAVDLDGTLLNKNNPQVWDNILLLIETMRLKRQRFEIIIATGRTLFGAKDTITRLYGKKDLPIILYNGSVIVRSEDFRILYKRTISKYILISILEKLDKYNVSTFAYFYLDITENLFDNTSKEYVLGWCKGERMEIEFNKMKIQWDADDEYLRFDPSAILIDISNETEGNIKQIQQLIGNFTEISATSSGFNYIEIRPLNSDKAKALEFVSSFLKISKQHILAIGDNDNDSEMLEWAGIGVCMSKATTKAINACQFQCTHDVASGVLEVLRVIKSSKRYTKYYEKDR
jgi:5-amino-6-(5-phospho-D-ribitylamino)uracil phosphatase